MDRAVLDAYGWHDIPTACDFELEWGDETADEDTGRRKKPWRYRWPEPVRDEVLARLLKLNAERAAAEAAERQVSGLGQTIEGIGRKHRVPLSTDEAAVEVEEMEEVE